MDLMTIWVCEGQQIFPTRMTRERISLDSMLHNAMHACDPLHLFSGEPWIECETADMESNSADWGFVCVHACSYTHGRSQVPQPSQSWSVVTRMQNQQKKSVSVCEVVTITRTHMHIKPQGAPCSYLQSTITLTDQLFNMGLAASFTK